MDQLTTALSLDRQLGDAPCRPRDHNTAGGCLRQVVSAEALSHAQEALQLCRAREQRMARPAPSTPLAGATPSSAITRRRSRAASRRSPATATSAPPRLGRGRHPGQPRLRLSPSRPTTHEAIACYQQAIDLLGDTGDPDHAAEFLIHLGDACDGAGEREAARRAWQQSLAVRNDLQHPAVDQLRSRLAIDVIR